MIWLGDSQLTPAGVTAVYLGSKLVWPVYDKGDLFLLADGELWLYGLSELRKALALHASALEGIALPEENLGRAQVSIPTESIAGLHLTPIDRIRVRDSVPAEANPSLVLLQVSNGRPCRSVPASAVLSTAVTTLEDWLLAQRSVPLAYDRLPMVLVDDSAAVTPGAVGTSAGCLLETILERAVPVTCAIRLLPGASDGIHTITYCAGLESIYAVFALGEDGMTTITQYALVQSDLCCYGSGVDGLQLIQLSVPRFGFSLLCAGFGSVQCGETASPAQTPSLQMDGQGGLSFRFDNALTGTPSVPMAADVTVLPFCDTLLSPDDTMRLISRDGLAFPSVNLLRPDDAAFLTGTGAETFHCSATVDFQTMELFGCSVSLSAESENRPDASPSVPVTVSRCISLASDAVPETEQHRMFLTADARLQTSSFNDAAVGTVQVLEVNAELQIGYDALAESTQYYISLSSVTGMGAGSGADCAVDEVQPALAECGEVLSSAGGISMLALLDLQAEAGMKLTEEASLETEDSNIWARLLSPEVLAIYRVHRAEQRGDVLYLDAEPWASLEDGVLTITRAVSAERTGDTLVIS